MDPPLRLTDAAPAPPSTPIPVITELHGAEGVEYEVSRTIHLLNESGRASAVVQACTNLASEHAVLMPNYSLKPIEELDPTTKIVELPKIERKVKAKRTMIQELPCFGGLVPTTVSGGAEDFLNGFSSRAGSLRLVPKPGVWEKLVAEFRVTEVGAALYTEQHIEVTDADFEKWLLAFPPSQQVTLRKANKDNKYSKLSRRDLLAAPFVKVEKQANLTVGGPPAVTPRIVVSHKPNYLAAVGPVIKTACKGIRRNMAGLPATWITGMSAEDFGALVDRAVETVADPVFIWGDHSRFEKAMSAQTCEAVRTVQRRFSEIPIYLQGIEEMDGIHGMNQGMDYKVDVPYVLSSGLPQTSQSSAVRNLFALHHVFGVPDHKSMVFFFNGDDWLIVVSRARVVAEEDFHKAMTELGFKSEYHLVEDIAEVEFCQLLMWPVNGKTVPGPKPFRVLSRIPWSISHQASAASIAQGLIVSGNHVPFLGPYLRKVRKLAGRSVAAKQEEWQLRATKTHACAPDTYDFFRRRYGLGPTDERLFEKVLATVTQLKCILDWPGFAELVELDV